MSLTTQLKDPKSPVRVWLETNARPIIGLSRIVSGQEYPRPFVPEESIPSLAGTAFDYLFRWSVEGLEPTSLVAYHGADRVGRRGVVMHLVTLGNAHEELRPACAVAMSYFEQLARAAEFDPSVVPISLEHLQRSSAVALIDLAHEPTVRDIRSLMTHAHTTFGPRLKERFIPNPTFTGSRFVGGADGDWILGRVLYDCKVSGMAKPVQPEYLIQLACYALLDWDDEYKIETIALYLPRQQIIREWALSKLFPNLATARASFRSHITGRSTY